ncbi:MAG: M48 family metalloprotease [Rickettsiales bacterium]|nr:M48 family metalloprotease [Rickettsiales bacterium]
MFVKPFSIILVYILTIINFLILTIPFLIIFLPFVIIDEQGFIRALIDFFNACAFIISFVMIFYLIVDMVFGFSVWSLTRKDKPTKKFVNKYNFMAKIEDDFQDLRKKFKSPNIKLLISRSGEINAYAVGSIRVKYVVLTFGLLKHYQDNCINEKEFHSCIKAIMGHEISHVINNDYLPALLLILNDKAVNFVSFFIRIFFNIFINLTRSIPYLGSFIYTILFSVHTLTNTLINCFYKYIIFPIYNFIKLHLNRQIEYRCDKQAALACSGEEMAIALSLLGSSGYMTIFSSHPKTKDRVNYIKNIKHSEKKLSASFVNKISNLSSILILVFILNTSYKNIDLNLYKRKMIMLKYKIENVKNSLFDYKYKIERFLK